MKRWTVSASIATPIVLLTVIFLTPRDSILNQISLVLFQLCALGGILFMLRSLFLGSKTRVTAPAAVKQKSAEGTILEGLGVRYVVFELVFLVACGIIAAVSMAKGNQQQISSPNDQFWSFTGSFLYGVLGGDGLLALINFLRSLFIKDDSAKSSALLRLAAIHAILFPILLLCTIAAALNGVLG